MSERSERKEGIEMNLSLNFVKDYIDLDENICDVCKNELKRRFSTLLHDNFTEEEIDILNELYDGEEIR